MARLKLKDGKTHRQVGEAIMKMGAATYRSNLAEPFDPTPAYVFEEEFLDLFQDRAITVPQTLKQVPHVPVEDGVAVLFHFDRTIEDDGRRMRIVNIAVPNFEGKLTQRLQGAATKSSGELEFELDDLAAEAFGYIVIFGCAG
jgi:hypothetical protein